jgi:hypothetical protein
MLKKIDTNPKAFAIFYGAVGSILASLIWAFAPSFGDWLGTSTLGVLVDFVNARYIRAATLEPVNYSFFVLTAILVVFAVLWFEIAGRIKKSLLGTSDNEVEKKEPPPWMKKLAYIFIQFVIPLYIFYGLIQISGEVIVLNAITDFKQHMLIVTPYIEKEEKEKLLSQWSQMRSIDDYNKVYERLVAVAKEHNLKLYKNRMY